jgi:hypothetical protein
MYLRGGSQKKKNRCDQQADGQDGQREKGPKPNLQHGQGLRSSLASPQRSVSNV